MAAYRWVTAKNLDQFRNLTLGNRVFATFPFFVTNDWLTAAAAAGDVGGDGGAGILYAGASHHGESITSAAKCDNMTMSIPNEDTFFF